MALITCEECGNKVSDLAKACPECGFPIKKKIIEKKVTCFECGEIYLQSKKDCPKCGAPNKQTTKFDLSPNDEKVRENIKKAANFAKKYPKKNKVVIPGIVIVGLIYLIIGIFSQNNSNREPIRTGPTTISPPPTNLDICQLCKINNSCDVIPQCDKGGVECSEFWDPITGNWKTRCKRF